MSKQISFRNFADTISSFLKNAATQARTWTFQDRDGIIADDTDLATKQDTLLSGTNIKTVNGNSLLGSGDIAISGSGTVATLAQAQAGTNDSAYMSPLKNSYVNQRVYNVEAYGAVHDGTTDDAAAINSAIAACLSGGGGVVYFPKGIYQVSSAVDSVGNSNAQIYFPLDSSISSSSTLKKVELVGEVGPNMYANPFTTTGGNAYPQTGVVIRSTLLSSGSVIGARYETVGWGNFNFMHISIRNIMVVIRSKTSGTDVAAQATGIDGRTFAFFEADNVGVITESAQNASVQPASTAFGIRMPAINNWVVCTLKQCFVFGMYVGFEIGEHSRVYHSFVDVCYQGVRIVAAAHAIHVDSICIARCRTNIVVTGTCYFRFDNVSFEDDPSNTIGTPGWNVTVYDLDEQAGSSEGTIFFHRVKAGLGSEVSFTRNGTASTKIFAISLAHHAPVWTNANKPTSARSGFYGYNSDKGYCEVYNGSLWLPSAPQAMPTQLQGLATWFDACDLTTITKDGSNRVSAWNDKSGGGFNLSNAGANTTYPVWTASKINGLPTLVFTSANSQKLEYGKITAIQGLSGFTIFVIGGKGGVFFGQSASSTARTYVLPNWSSNNNSYFGVSNGTDNFGNYNEGSQKYALHTVIYDGTQGANSTRLVVRESGAQLSLNFTNTIPATTESDANSNFLVGAYFVSPSTYTYYSGEIGEFIMFKRTLNTFEIRLIEAYLQHKWGL